MEAIVRAWRRVTARGSLPALLAITGLGLGIAGCGGASTSTRSSSQVASHVPATAPAPKPKASTRTLSTDYAKVDGDKDNDVGTPDLDPRNGIPDFGRPASEPSKRAIVALVKRYYATALAGDGAKACPMIYSTLAESTPEDYGVPGGPEYLRGAKTCQAVMSRLFRHFHAQLAVEVPKLEVTRVLIKQRQGKALLSFAKLPEREIDVAREGHAWRMTALLDSELP